jgi:hypothetical protein
MANKPDPERYHLTVEPVPGRRTPAEVRLRTWLKLGLRAMGIRTVEIRPADENPPGPPPPPPAA